MTGPDAPSAPDLDDGSDSGASASDNLTNDTTPTLTGTGPADTTIRIYEGGVLVAEGTSDSAGNWSITLPAQSEGTHAYEVRSVRSSSSRGPVEPSRAASSTSAAARAAPGSGVSRGGAVLPSRVAS